MLLRAQLADDRAEDAGADRLLVVVDQHRRVRIEPDGRAVGAVDVLGGADDHRLVDVALLDAAARRGLLHRHDDDVADAGEAALRAAQHLDALDALCAAIVGDVEVRLHLDHRSIPSLFFASSPQATSALAGVAWVSTRSITRHVFNFEIGRVSSMRTVSPSRYSLPSSWA